MTPTDFPMNKDKRRRILSHANDWNKALLPNGKLALEPCFVHQSVPDIQPIILTAERDNLVQLSVQTKTDLTRNLLKSGIADPSDTQTLEALRFCTTVFDDDPKMKQVVSVKKKKDLHHLRYRLEAVVDLADIARLTLEFENELNRALDIWPTQSELSWKKLVELWSTYGFLWPERLYLGTNEPEEGSSDTVETDDKAVDEKRSQGQTLIQQHQNYYVTVCRAQLRPIHEFFPAAYSKQKKYIDTILKQVLSGKALEERALARNGLSPSFVVRSQEQQSDRGPINSSNYSKSSSSSSSSSLNPVETMNSPLTTRKKGAHPSSSSFSTGAVATQKRNNDQWKLSISPSNSSASMSNRVLPQQQQQQQQQMAGLANHRRKDHVTMNECYLRSSSSIRTDSEDGDNFSASPATKSSGHTQPTSEFPSPHSSNKSRTAFVDTNVIITVQQLFENQQSVLVNSPQNRAELHRQQFKADDEKHSVRALGSNSITENTSKNSKLFEIAIASMQRTMNNHSIDYDRKEDKQKLNKSNFIATHREPLKDAATTMPASDNNDFQSSYAESHYTTAAGTITTTSSSVTSDVQQGPSSIHHKPAVSLSARQLEKQPLRALEQAGFTWDDIPEEYSGEHDDHYAWSTSSCGDSSISSLPALTPSQSAQLPSSIGKRFSLQESKSDSTSSSHRSEGQLTEAELYKREVQKKLEAKEDAYAAICRNILCLGTPLSNTTNSQIRYYDDIDEEEEGSGNNQASAAHKSRNADHQQLRTMTPKSRLSNRTTSSSANLSPEEYLSRKKAREISFLKLLQHNQESKQKMLTRAMRQSTLRYWLQDIFIAHNGQSTQQQQQQQQRRLRGATNTEADRDV